MMKLRSRGAVDSFGFRSLCLVVCLGVTVFSAQAQTNLAPPVFVSATDGAYSDLVRVTWLSDSNYPPSAGYQLWRGVSNTHAMASLVMDWIGSTNVYVDDATVVPDIHYYYWMKSYGFEGSNRVFSAFSLSDQGYAQASTNPPPSLTCVSFNNGEQATGVVTLRWTSVSLPSGETVRIEYSPYYGFSFSTVASNVPASDEAFAWDTSTLPDSTQAMWRISSKNYSNAIDVCDHVFRVINPHVTPPSSVDASRNTYTDRIAVWWRASALADSYDVYRSTVMNSLAAVLIGHVSGTNFTDFPVQDCNTYWYWIKASRSIGGGNTEVSGFSTPAGGWTRPVRYIPSPHGISASDGTCTNQIVVSWYYDTNLVGAAIYRSTNANSASAVPIKDFVAWDWNWNGEYSDTSVVAGVTYYYWVKFCDYDYDGSTIVYSAFSPMDSGFSANVPPTAVLIATPTNGCAPLRVRLDASESTDVDGAIVRMEVDREGDGIYETSLDSVGGLIVDYASAGIFHPTIRVTDSMGAKAVASASVTVWGAGPTAVLEATPTAGSAPLSVLFTATNSVASAGRWLAVYEWDPDGDGQYDCVTTNTAFSWVYGAAGTNGARLRVTDNQGLQSVAVQSIVVSPAANPPVVSLSASPTAGSIPLAVSFSAQVEDGSGIVAYKWDFDGDGNYDLSTGTNVASYTYTRAGVYPASVTVVDQAGLSDRDAASVTATVAQVLKVWISTPHNGAVLWGETVSLRAQTAPGHLTQAVRFEYKRTDEESWTALGGQIYPPPYSFSASWNVTGLSVGSNYYLRARALDTDSNEVLSDPITVKIDSGLSAAVGAIVEGVVDGKAQKDQVFSKDETTFVGTSDGTQIIVPAGTVDSNNSIRVVLTGLNTNAPGGSAAGKASIDANRKVSINGEPSLAKPITIIIPYDDADQDGIVDGSGVPEMTLTAHWFDTSSGQWRRALSSDVYPDENCLRATTYHLTEFGLFGNKNLLHPANGSILETFTSEISETNGVQNLTDDNPVSYWQSEIQPSHPQEMVYSFKDAQSALIAGAGIYNQGSGGEGFSRAFQILGSINGTDYSVLTNGNLAPTLDAQIFNFGSVTCRYVKLVIADGVDTQAWELAEFELYGDLTPDADANTLTDAWEVHYFGDLASNGATNDTDGDGVQNSDELSAGTNPTMADTDGDGMSDGDEAVAGTSAINAGDFFAMSDLAVSSGATGNLLGNSGFEDGWNPAASVPCWSHNIPLETIAGSWGDVALANGAVYSGTNCALIQNLGGNSIGAWWQQVPGPYPAGTVWSASAWVRNDAAYTNDHCEMKVEFLDAQTNWIETVFHNFTPPGEAWQQVSGLATSPAGTVNVRFVFAAVGQGTSGSLQFDEVSLAPVLQSEWVIKWASASGRQYTIYQADNLNAQREVIEQVSGTGFEMSYTNHVLNGAQGFMCVTVQKE